MTDTRFLKITLSLIAIPALILLFLPDKALSTYINVMEPLALLIGSILAWRLSSFYRKQLKAAFVFLAAYLLIYALAIILFTYGKSLLGDYYLGTLFLVQVINYSMLIIFCINILAAINIRQLNRNGWLLFAVTFIFSAFVALYPVLPIIKDIANLGLPQISYIMIRTVDAVLIIALVPVVWLYIQYLKSKQKQSLTFTIIIIGIVCSTLFDYLFESITQVFPQLLAATSPLNTTIPEMLFIYGYSIIAVGLYAHCKQDQWGFNTVDKAMGGQ